MFSKYLSSHFFIKRQAYRAISGMCPILCSVVLPGRHPSLVVDDHMKSREASDPMKSRKALDPESDLRMKAAKYELNYLNVTYHNIV